MQNRTQSLLRHTRIPSLETCGLALLCLFYVRLAATAMMSFELIPSGGGGDLILIIVNDDEGEGATASAIAFA